MLSDKPKLVFTDIAGRVTLEPKLACQQIKHKPKQTPEQAFLSALYNVGEALK